MARLFDDASSQYLEADSAPVSGTPLSMACWFNSDDVAADQGLIFLGDKNATNQYWAMRLKGTSGGDPLQAETNAGGSSTANTSTGYSANTWMHGAAIFASATSRAAYINGGSKGTNGTSRAPSAPNRISIGRYGDSTPSEYMSGKIAEAGIWNIALSDEEVALLAQGFSPLLIRPEALVAYWRLIGRYSPEIDLKGGVGLTVTGATAADHCRIFYPSGMQKQQWKGPAPPALTVDQWAVPLVANVRIRPQMIGY